MAHESNIPDLVLLMRAYCDTSDEPHVPKPSNDDLIKLCQNVLKDPDHEGVYLLARKDNDLIGFASVFWSWSYKPCPGRQAILSDLYVSPNARGLGIAGLLIQACQEQARQQKNIHSMIWQTAIDNYSAQKTYQRLGFIPKNCVDYELEIK